MIVGLGFSSHNEKCLKDVNDSTCSAAGFGLFLAIVVDSIAALTHCKQKHTLKL